MKKIFPVIFILSCLLAFWELSASKLSPLPSQILQTTWQERALFYRHALVTLSCLLPACLLAFVTALALAVLMLRYSFLRRFLEPLSVLTQSIPTFAISPLLVLAFGWSLTALIIPTWLSLFFPLSITLLQGMQSVPKALLDRFTVLGVAPFWRLVNLHIPYAMPSLFSGLRIMAAFACICTVAAESVAGQAGLGVLMQESRRGLDLELTFGAILVMMLLSLGLTALVAVVEGKVLRRLRFVLPLLMLGVLTSCEPASKKTVLLLDWLPNPNHVALYHGQKEGFFAKEGIDLEILILPDGGEAPQMLKTGQVDLAVYYMSPSLKAYQKNSDLRVAATLIDKPLNCILLKKGADLQSCLLGCSCPELPGQKRIIDKLKIPHERVIRLGYDLNFALVSGQVDAVLGVYHNIEGAQLDSLGFAYEVLSLEDMGEPAHHELIVLTTAAYTEAPAFARALQASIDSALAKPELAFNNYLRANPDKARVAEKWEKKAWQLTLPYLAKEQVIPNDLWMALQKWLGLPQNDLSAFVPPHLKKRALKLL